MPTILYDMKAPKKTVNLSINSDLLRQLKMLRINLSQVLERHLSHILSEERRRQWIEANQEAIESYNQRIETCGTFSDGLRRF